MNEAARKATARPDLGPAVLAVQVSLLNPPRAARYAFRTTSWHALNFPLRRHALLSKGWTAFFVALIVVCALAPVLNLAVPPDECLLHERLRGGSGRQDHVLRHLRAGHGPYLGLHRHPVAGPQLRAGRPMMGMYLMRQIGRDENGYKSDLPDFMVFLDWKTLPWHWTFSDSFIATLISASSGLAGPLLSLRVRLLRLLLALENASRYPREPRRFAALRRCSSATGDGLQERQQRLHRLPAS